MLFEPWTMIMMIRQLFNRYCNLFPYFEFKDPYKFRCGFCLLLLTQGSNKVKTKLKGSNCVIDHWLWDLCLKYIKLSGGNLKIKTHLINFNWLLNISFISRGPSWLWSYGSWIYNYLCNQCISPLTLWVRIPVRRGVLDTTLCDKVCQCLAAGQWFSLGTPVSSTNKTYLHDITEMLLKVALSTIP